MIQGERSHTELELVGNAQRNFHVVKNLPLCLILALFPTGLLRKNEPSSLSSGASFAPWMNILQVQIKCSTAAIYFLSLTKELQVARLLYSMLAASGLQQSLPARTELPSFFCLLLAVRL